MIDLRGEYDGGQQNKPEPGNVTGSRKSESLQVEPWTDPENERLWKKVTQSQKRLVELETNLAVLKSRIGHAHAKMFYALAPLRKKRDRLLLKIDYLKKLMDLLKQEDKKPGDRENLEREYQQADEQKQWEYQEAAKNFSSKKELNEDEKRRLKAAHRKLVFLFHPDPYLQSDPDKWEMYNRLFSFINEIKDKADIKLLEEFAADPNAFALRHGMGMIELVDRLNMEEMQTMHDGLKERTRKVQNEQESLEGSLGYKIYELSEDPIAFAGRISREGEALKTEIQELKEQVGQLDGRTDDLKE